MSKIIKYGAVGEEGCEFMARTRLEVEAWIAEEVAGKGHSDTPVHADYYQVYGYSQKEIDEMVEV